jgi:hypothetical protein
MTPDETAPKELKEIEEDFQNSFTYRKCKTALSHLLPFVNSMAIYCE